MKILVTGGAGFIGSHLVDALVKFGHQVVIVDDLSCGKKELINKKAKFYKLDINSQKIAEVFSREKPTIVFHLAAQKSVPYSLKYPLADVAVNVSGSMRIMECASQYRVRKFIFISTGGALYGAASQIPSPETTPVIPTSPYGLSKWTVENYLQNFYGQVKGLNYVILRLSNVYGPRQDPFGEAGVIAIFVNNLLHNKKCYINGQGNQTRDFVYVADVVEACLAALKGKQGIYNIGTNKEISIKDLFQMIFKRLKGVKATHRAAIKGEILRSCLDIKKARQGLKWQPQYSLSDGLEKTIDWFSLL